MLIGMVCFIFLLFIEMFLKLEYVVIIYIASAIRLTIRDQTGRYVWDLNRVELSTVLHLKSPGLSTTQVDALPSTISKTTIDCPSPVYYFLYNLTH